MIWPLSPMKATSGKLPHGDAWVYEPKWDGHRALLRLGSGGLDAVSSTGQPRLERWAFLTGVPDAVAARSFVLDGEVVAMGDDGRHSFGLVGRPDRPHALVLFDVLEHDGTELLSTPFDQRRALLEQIVTPTSNLFVTPITDDAEALMTATKATGFEGIIAKRTDSLYQPGRRTPNWLKIKHRHEQEMVIAGYQRGEGNRSDSFGSLILGVQEAGGLRFVGSVGTGFNDKTLTEIRRLLAERVTTTCPFAVVPKFPRGKVTWVRPDLVAQVGFGEWTEAGIVRHPVFLGLRDDKDAADVVREP